MVRYHNSINTVVNGQKSVLGSRDTLDPHLHLISTLLLQPLDVSLPGKCRVGCVRVECDGTLWHNSVAITVCVSCLAASSGCTLTSLLSLSIWLVVALSLKVWDLEVCWQLELVSDFEVAAAEDRCVDSEEDGFVACLLCSLQQLDTVVALLEEVKL